MAKFDKSKILPPFEYARNILTEIGVKHQTRFTKNGWPYFVFRHPENNERMSFQFRKKDKKHEDSRIIIFQDGEDDVQKRTIFKNMSSFLEFIGLPNDKINELSKEQTEFKKTKNEMKTEIIKTGAIIDDHSEIIEIKDSKNIALDDGYNYLKVKGSDTVYRSSESTHLVDGEFTLYETKADVEAAIAQPKI